ncbi:MAG: alkaline phosphatase PhoX [Ilumatobacteraceae bacterium]
MDRRAFLGTIGAAAAGSILGRQFWDGLAHAATVVGPGPYGALGSTNGDGLRLPAGFVSRVVATTGAAVGPATRPWHGAPDGGACFARSGGGWVYVSNSEIDGGRGGAGVIVFDAAGGIVDSYSILSGTSRNCAGGPTPWGTWLSCEEHASGRVWECDPSQPGQGVVRPALGTFSHEAAVVDPATSVVYLTEDDPDGRLYRFVPTVPGDLSAGRLEAASVSGTTVTWRTASTTAPNRASNTTRFAGGEGAWIADGSLFFTTKGDNRVRELVLASQTMTVLYDASAQAGSPLTGVDNITGHAPSGDLFVCEDGGNLEICVLARAGADRVVAPFLRVIGHTGSELTGAAFSPDGSRLYFSSQRGVDGAGRGVTFEVSGAFRTAPDPEPENPAPVARFTVVQTGNHVALDGTSSTAAGSISTWSWDFGDGTTGTGAQAAHDYLPGNYALVLTVTDDRGATASSGRQVTVAAPSTVSFVGARSENASTRTPGVRVPTAVRAGDLLVLIVTANSPATLGTPSGWTLRGSVADPQPDTRSWLFTRTAPGSLAGSRVSATLSATAKVCTTVVAYRGASPSVVVAATEESASTARHRSPALSAVPAGAWVLGYWADETSGNTGWSAPTGHRTRSSSAGTGSGRITALAADTGPVGAGSWPGATATSTVASRKSVAWSVGIVPA